MTHQVMPKSSATPTQTPHIGVQQGIMLHSPAMTLAMVQALQAVVAAANSHHSTYELRKLSGLGLKPQLARYLTSLPAATIAQRIELARSESLAVKAQVESPLNLYGTSKLTAIERALYDYGQWSVPVGMELLSALAHDREHSAAALSEQTAVYLIRAGARAGTMNDLMGMGIVKYRALLKKHRIKRPAGDVGGRPPLPSAELAQRIQNAWATICEESKLERVYPTLADKYQAVHKHLLADVDLAIVHRVVQGRVV
jgi:hypothetical protein